MELSAEVIKGQRANEQRSPSPRLNTMYDGIARWTHAALKTKLPEENVEEYQRELDAYIQSRAGQEPSIATGRSEASSDRTRAFSR